jgi:large conductance mechanosensitive channel
MHIIHMSMWNEFMEFMKKQNVVALALGLVTGLAAKTLIDALVADLITPIYKPYIGFLDPKMSVNIGLSQFMVGDFIQALISFAVILLVVFIIGKKMGKSL